MISIEFELKFNNFKFVKELNKSIESPSNDEDKKLWERMSVSSLNSFEMNLFL